jgi:hypothetical protein
MTFKRNVILFSSLMAAVPANAASWELATIANNGAIWFVDKGSIKEVADGYNSTAKKAWIKIDFSSVKSEKAREMKMLYFFKCDDEKIKLISTISYAPDGSVMRSYTPNFSSYDPVVPDSVMASAMEMVCAAS